MTALKDVSMNTNMHAAFLRELDRISKALASSDLGNGDRRTKLANRFQFFSATLHHHHEGEDKFLFERSKKRATPSDIAVLDQLEAEHGELLEILTSLDRQFASLSADSDKELLTNELAALATVLRQHGEHEEAKGMPIVQKYVTEADVKEFMKFNRSGETASLTLPWVCDGAPTAVSVETWGMLPGPVRLFVKPMLTRKYNKFSEQCGI